MFEHYFPWTVVGAGPAGLLAVGKLLDAGVPEKSIFWIDPSFTVGDFGEYWFSVPSNTRVSFFNQFLTQTRAFNYASCPAEYSLAHLNENDTCLLSEMVRPLQWITQCLRERVICEKGLVQSLQKANGRWQLNTTSGSVFSDRVILALGASPKKLHHHHTVKEIALSVALNPALLKEQVSPGKHVVVFGASHSGVLVMKNLLEAKCQVTNFYRCPLRYALYQEDHIVYDNTGLKGRAASWAKENLEGQTISGLTRHLFTKTSPEEVLPSADYIVYAIGFTARSLFSSDIDCGKYDAHTGIIAPGLFGLGIAYPEKIVDRYGIHEMSVGLFKFSTYLTKVLPLWMSYP